MSKVVRLSDVQLHQLEEYQQLRFTALQLFQKDNPFPERWYLDSLEKLENLSDLALLSDCLAYAINSLRYDIQSLQPAPPSDDILERVAQLQDAIPDK